VLSAQLDGAATPTEWARTRQHLETCAECRAFRTDLLRLQGLTARASTPAGPDLVPWALRVATPRAADGDPRASLSRSLLGAVALAQIVLGLPALVAGGGAGDVHDSRHLGAWAVAFGVGLLLAAFRPSHARSLLPVAVTLLVAVAATTVADLVAGQRSAGAEAIHALEAVGVVLLALVAREEASGSPRPVPLGPVVGPEPAGA
jgi:predicted anti-sigma-YlaC factor YlaD